MSGQYEQRASFPNEVTEAIVAWGRSMIVGPKICTCEPVSRYGEEFHAECCQWIQAGIQEHYAGEHAKRVVRKWAEEQVKEFIEESANDKEPQPHDEIDRT